MDKLKPLYPPLVSQREVVTEWGESLRAEGVEEGIVKGRAEGRAEGVEEGRVNALLKDVRKLMQNLNLPPEKAMAVLDVSESDRMTLMPLLQ